MKRFKAYLVPVTVLFVFSVGWRGPSTTAPSGLTNPLNMSLQDTLLYVSDHSSGIHIYNVKDPTAPAFVLNIPLRGNRGTAARGNILYANDRGSLLAIRVEGTSYEVVKTIKRGDGYYNEIGMIERDRGWGCACSPGGNLSAPDPSRSAGSSYATFAVIDSYLYYLDNFSIVTLDISEPADPIEVSQTPIGWGVETLFPTDDYLFVGGERGMYIFDRSDPESPKAVSRIEHFRACDPVVVADTLAFVTLRGGNGCGETRDVLLSLSIKNPGNPVVIKEKSVKTPHGLAIDGPLLYVSTGRNGFELFDVTSPGNPSTVRTWYDWATKDFVWFGNTLYVMGFGDVRIYDVSTPEDPTLLSQID